MKFKSIAGVAIITLASAILAAGASDRTFVATTGTDSPTCGDVTSPCRNFAYGMSQTNEGGVVIALDSGIYDPIYLTITKSITLLAAPGVHAELFNYYVEPSFRIDIAAGKHDTIVLRNLYLSHLGGKNSDQGTGILAESFGDLQIENCVIDGFARGININTSSAGRVSMSDTTVRNGGYGVSAQSFGGLINVSIDNCHFEHFSGNGNDPSSNLGNGVEAFENSRILVKNTVASGGDGAGFFAGATGADLVADNCEATGNRDGFYAPATIFGAGTMTVSNSVASYNSRHGFFQSGSSIFNSLGNNSVRRNGGANTAGTITVVSGT